MLNTLVFSSTTPTVEFAPIRLDATQWLESIVACTGKSCASVYVNKRFHSRNEVIASFAGSPDHTRPLIFAKRTKARASVTNWYATEIQVTRGSGAEHARTILFDRLVYIRRDHRHSRDCIDQVSGYWRIKNVIGNKHTCVHVEHDIIQRLKKDGLVDRVNQRRVHKWLGTQRGVDADSATRSNTCRPRINFSVSPIPEETKLEKKLRRLDTYRYIVIVKIWLELYGIVVLMDAAPGRTVPWAYGDHKIQTRIVELNGTDERPKEQDVPNELFHHYLRRRARS